MLNTKQVAKLIGKSEPVTRRLAMTGKIGRYIRVSYTFNGHITAMFIYSKPRIAEYLGITREELNQRLEEMKDE